MTITTNVLDSKIHKGALQTLCPVLVDHRVDPQKPTNLPNHSRRLQFIHMLRDETHKALHIDQILSIDGVVPQWLNLVLRLAKQLHHGDKFRLRYAARVVGVEEVEHFAKDLLLTG